MSTELKRAAQMALDALTEMIVAGKSNTWAAQQAVHDLRTALQSAQASEPGVSDDSKRLDYLQDRGATIDLVPGVAGFYPMRFRVGGLHSSASIDVRAAIDAAKLAASQVQKGGE